jgi:MerR family Zn(II)-responsive transcriptional regulator of zntA
MSSRERRLLVDGAILDLPVEGKVKSGRTAGDKECQEMRIGEVAEATGTTTKTLRFYEEQGLLPEADRTPSGYRDYGVATLNRLDFIHRGQAAGLTLAEIRQILEIRDRGDAPCAHVRDLLTQRLRDLDKQVAELVALRESIVDLQSAATNAEPETCSADQVCRYL